MVAIGPIAGIVMRNDVRTEVATRQKIANSTNCFVQRNDNATQLCNDVLTVQITFFSIENSAEVTTNNAMPIFRETGPYFLHATERHAGVYYDSVHRVHFTKKEASLTQLEALCGNCDWSQQIAVFQNNDLITSSVEELMSDLWPSTETAVVLDTGTGSLEHVYDTIQYGVSDNVEGKFNGRLFGNNFSPKRGAVIYDEWLERKINLEEKNRNNTRGVGVISMELDISEGCVNRGYSCGDLLWNKSSELVYSLPYLHHENGSFSNSFTNFDENEHGWHILIDRSYGFTVHKQTTYQENHWIDAFGGGGYWAPSYWIAISYSASDDEISFIKRNQRKELLAFYVLDLTVPLFGAIIICLLVGWMMCTTKARKRLATIAILARSRARDARLNPSQFKALGTFLRTQMRRKGRTTSSTNVNTKTTRSTSAKSKTEFDDVRNMPNTQSV
eukprot:g7235.t1